MEESLPSTGEAPKPTLRQPSAVSLDAPRPPSTAPVSFLSETTPGESRHSSFSSTGQMESSPPGGASPPPAYEAPPAFAPEPSAPQRPPVRNPQWIAPRGARTRGLCTWDDEGVRRCPTGSRPASHRELSASVDGSLLRGIPPADDLNAAVAERAVREASAISQFREIVSTGPHAASLTKAYRLQETYETNGVPNPEEGHRNVVLDMLESAPNEISYMNANKYELKCREPNPVWQGEADTTNEEYVYNAVNIVPGDVVWAGGETGICGTCRLEMYVGLRNGRIPWGICLGTVNGGVADEARESDCVTAGPLLHGSSCDSTGCGRDGSTVGVYDFFDRPIPIRPIPRMNSLLAAASSIGLHMHKLSPHGFVHAHGEHMDVAGTRREVRSCQSFASFLVTGRWLSPAVVGNIENAKVRLLPQVALKAIRAAKQLPDVPLLSVSGSAPGITVPHTLSVVEEREESEESVAIEEHAVMHVPVASPNATNEECVIEKASLRCYREALQRRKEKLLALCRDVTWMRHVSESDGVRVRERLAQLQGLAARGSGAQHHGVSKKKTSSPSRRRTGSPQRTAAAHKRDTVENEMRILKRWLRDMKRIDDDVTATLHRYKPPQGHTIESDIAALTAAITEHDETGHVTTLPAHMLQGRLKLTNNIHVKCGDQDICMNIQELRERLALQKNTYVVDPTFQKMYTSAQLESIMREPPRVEDRELRALLPDDWKTRQRRRDQMGMRGPRPPSRSPSPRRGRSPPRASSPSRRASSPSRRASPPPP